MENIATPNKIYYKIQAKNPVSMAWIDIQKAYTTIENVMQHFTDKQNMRIIVIDGKKRYPL